MYWITGILGLALVLAPFVVGYAENTVALATSCALGVVVLAMSVLEAVKSERDKWEYWVAFAIGLLSLVAPFALGFSEHPQALWTSVLLGVLIAVTAGSRLYTGQFRQ